MKVLPGLKTSTHHTTLCLLLAAVAALFFIPFLGNAHLFDWDEINFAEVSREMVITGNFASPQIDFAHFTEKPPLFFWLQALSMKAFGINEFAARLPNALLGTLVLPILFSIGKKIRNTQFGLLWVLAYFGSILPHLYYKSGIIDPYFNFFIFLGIYGIIRASWKGEAGQKNLAWLLFGGFATGMAILTKGPAALIITGLVIAVVIIGNRFRLFMPLPQLLIWFITALLVTASWFVYNYLRNGSEFIVDFTIRQWELFSKPDAGQKGFLLYHFVFLFFGCFPASTFLIHAFTLLERNDKRMAAFKKWMSILFWVVLILFTIVSTKIVHYSSLCYFPLSFLAAYSLYALIFEQQRFRTWMKISLVVAALPFVLAPFAFVYGGRHIEAIKPLFKKDLFAMENLEAGVHWTGMEILPGILLLLVTAFVIVYAGKKFTRLSIILLFAGSALYIQLSLFFLINRIEHYSQLANIEFWASKSGEDCYYTSYGYKTYTYYFYGKVMPHQNPRYYDKDWLLHGNIDKPLYISAKVNAVERLKKEVPDLEFLYHRNGFYFFKRPAANR
ncbi:MAG: phospholipid carrier-dependent glycosyltransferase [Terrimonas sp.]|nr:phospholipid carrier-dependent glycosyltransferase [Terrimonas sp.]